TFNPDHGSTGHEAHRTIGALVRETGFAAIWTIETRAAVAGDAITLWNGAPERASVLHANELWDALLRTVEMHESQFTPGQRDTLRTLPHEQRCVWWTAAR
ncbi:MAG TPA: hypothetical protein VFP80_00340, partial [Thermoanaerobaculia bacterium]|nr:hypothetical protein [Thermoanaerobaculia bacterium]